MSATVSTDAVIGPIWTYLRHASPGSVSDIVRIQSEVVGSGETISRMGAAVELTRMYLQRVSPEFTASDTVTKPAVAESTYHE